MKLVLFYSIALVELLAVAEGLRDKRHIRTHDKNANVYVSHVKFPLRYVDITQMCSTGKTILFPI